MNTILIVAGGSGKRMNTGIPKQFLEVLGKPVLMHTLECFHSHPSVDDIIIVLPAQELDTWNELCRKNGCGIPHRIATGGATRYESVRNGLKLVKASGIVGVHDGVRPLVSHELISRCLNEAEKHGNAVPVISVPESIRKNMEGATVAVNRSDYVLVQTPQCFSTEYIGKAYNGPEQDSFTDDASVLEAAGIKIHCVEGQRWNMKITFREDLEIAAAILKPH